MDNRIDSQEKALALKCLEFAKAEGASAARVTLNKSVMDLVGTLNGEIDKVSHCLDRSISLSLFVSGRYGTYSTNNICEDSLKDFVAKAVKTTSIFAEDGCRRLPDPSRKAKDAGKGDELGLYDAEYEAVTPESRISRALGASIYNELKPVSEEAEYSDCLYDTLVVDTDGLECRHTETSFEYGVEMTVSDGNGNKFSSFWWDASTFLKDFNLKGCARKAYDDAVAQFGPKPVESGKYNAVILSKVASKVVSPILNALGGYAIQQNNSFLLGKLGEAVFVGTTENIFLAAMFNHLDVGEQIHYVTESAFVELGTSKVFRQNVFQPLVFLFDGTHRIVNHRADFRRMGFGGNIAPPRTGRNKKDTFGGILVHIFLEAVAFFNKRLIFLIKTVGDIFEKNQPQHDIFIFGRVNIAAQHARRIPNLFFKADIGSILFSHR